MIVLQVILAAFSTACLVALGVYFYLASSGGSPTLYALSRRNPVLSMRQKLFLGFAALGLMVCIFNGAAAMLFWLPDSWGSIDEDGEFQTYRVGLALLFTMGAVGWLGFLEKASYGADRLDMVSVEAKGLREILNANESQHELESLKLKFSSKLTDLESAHKYSRGGISEYAPIHPEDDRIDTYRGLIHIIEVQQQQLDGHPPTISPIVSE